MSWNDLWWIGSVLLVLAGLAGAIVPILPGPLLVFAGLWLAAWIEGYAHVGTGTLMVLAIIMLLAHAMDFIAGLFGAKAGGASRWAMLGASIGMVVGLFFSLPGLILGPVLGAVAGEMYHQNNLPQATRAGIGAGIGVVVGMAVKIGLSFVMLGWFLLVRFL